MFFGDRSIVLDPRCAFAGRALEERIVLRTRNGATQNSGRCLGCTIATFERVGVDAVTGASRYAAEIQSQPREAWRKPLLKGRLPVEDILELSSI